MLNLKKNSNEKKFIRERIINLTREYVEKFGSNKKSNTINVTGKVINHEEICNIVDSALDMWLTSGRFNNEFQRCLMEPDSKGCSDKEEIEKLYSIGEIDNWYSLLKLRRIRVWLITLEITL